MNAAKRQQFRWAKGSIQVALKLLSDVMLHRNIPIETKTQAFIHLTRHTINPLFLAQFLIFPMLLAMDYELYTVSWAPLVSIFMYVMMGPGGYLIIINKTWSGEKWREKAQQFFFLMFYSTGLSVNNTVAVFDAVFGRKNEFLRTPKFGIVNQSDNWRNKAVCTPFHQDYTLGNLLCDLWMHGGFHLNLHGQSTLYSYDSDSNNWVHICSIS